MEMDPNIKKFLQDLLLEAGMGELPEADRESMLNDLYVRLEDRLMLAVLDALPDDRRADFQSRIEADDMSAEQVEQYIRENLPSYQQVFAQAFAEFRQLYLSAAAGE